MIQLAQESHSAPDPDRWLLCGWQVDHLNVVRVVTRGQQLARPLARFVSWALVNQLLRGGLDLRHVWSDRLRALGRRGRGLLRGISQEVPRDKVHNRDLGVDDFGVGFAQDGIVIVPCCSL